MLLFLKGEVKIFFCGNRHFTGNAVNRAKLVLPPKRFSNAVCGAVGGLRDPGETQLSTTFIYLLKGPLLSLVSVSPVAVDETEILPQTCFTCYTCFFFRFYEV